MSWDDVKRTNEELTADEWNEHVLDQKSRAKVVLGLGEPSEVPPMTGAIYADQQSHKVYIAVAANDVNDYKEVIHSESLDVWFGGKTTDDLAEGSNNLYFTDERAQDAVGSILTNTPSITFTYDNNEIKADVNVDGTTIEVDNTNNYIKVKDGVFALSSHTHDDRYYTETEIDNLLDNKSDVGHTHTKSDITDFSHTHTKSDITDFSHTHTISEITDIGNASVSYATNAGNANKLDNYDSSYFAKASDLSAHTSNTSNPHNVTASQVGAYTKSEADSRFVNVSGDTMSGALIVSNYAKIDAPAGLETGNDATFTTIQGTDWIELRLVDTKGFVVRRSTDAGSNWTEIFKAYDDTIKYKTYTVWHSGNDGSGSGLDADKLDGKHASDFAKVNEGNTFSGTQTFDGDIRVKYQHMLVFPGSDNANNVALRGNGENLEIIEPEDSNKVWAYFKDDDGLYLTGTPNLYVSGKIKTKTAYFESEYDNGSASGSKTINWNNGQKQRVTLTGNVTFSFTNPSGPCNLVLKIIQDSVGGHSVTFPSNVKWEGGNAPDLSSDSGGSVRIVSFYFDGTNYYAQITDAY